MPQFLILLVKNKKGAFGLGVIVFLTTISLLAPLLANHTPYRRSGYAHQPPSAEHYLGTTQAGKDVYSQVLYGGRISLMVGFTAGAIITFFAALVGISAAYFGGKIDELLVFLMNVFLVLPGLALLILLASLIDNISPLLIACIIAFTGWAYGARVIRAQAMTLIHREFVVASEIMGESRWRILIQQILPNLISLVVSNFVFSTIFAILTEAGLEFIGLGDPSSVTWGTSLFWAQRSNALMSEAWWDVLAPSFMILSTGGALALLNFSIDEITNPQLRTLGAQKKWNRLEKKAKSQQALSSEPASPDNLLEVRDLCVDYLTEKGTVRAVNQVSFTIGRGEVFGLAGESGCGKSTIAFAVSKLTKPPGLVTGGQILFEGKDVLEFSEKRLREFRWNEASVVFQSAMNALNPLMTVADQITDVLFAHTDLSNDAARERAKELLTVVGINAGRIDDYPHQFSGGMKQRIGIAIALALNPKLIIMDEPTTALDVVIQREIIQEIYQLKEKFGFSVLFITHDLSLMVEFSDRIGVMYAGELIEVAASKKIIEAPSHPYTEGLGNSFPSIRGSKRKLVGIPGNPLNLNAIPAGCRFQDRCGECVEQCRVDDPKLLEVHPQQWAACHLALARLQEKRSA